MLKIKFAVLWIYGYFCSNKNLLSCIQVYGFYWEVAGSCFCVNKLRGIGSIHKLTYSSIPPFKPVLQEFLILVSELEQPYFRKAAKKYKESMKKQGSGDHFPTLGQI